MSTLLYVGGGAAETVNKEPTETVFGSREIASLVNGREDVVSRNAAVERGNKPAETFFADDRIDVLFFHDRDANTGAGELLGIVDHRRTSFAREIGSSRIGWRIELGIRRWSSRGKRHARRSAPVMLWAKSQSSQSESVDFAVTFELLVGLEALESVDRIVVPFAVRLAFEIATISESLLDLRVALRIRMELITGGGSSMGNASGFRMPARCMRSRSGMSTVFRGRYVGSSSRRLGRCRFRFNGVGNESRGQQR